MILRDLVTLARPWQWSKNGILFAGLIFSLRLPEPAYALRTAEAFALFCLLSSALYALNDVLDVERDRLHPTKRERPIASGRVSRVQGLAVAVILAALPLIYGLRLGPAFYVCLLIFLALNVSYSLVLKNVVLLDVMMIAVSFVMRAIAGVMALRPLDAGIDLSPWLLVCTLFLALFLAMGKRRYELTFLENDAAGHRATLSEYSPAFLDQLINIVAAAAIIGYAIYTIVPGTVSRFHSQGLVCTIPFVVFGIFRYLFLIQMRRGGGNPSRTVYRDVPILVTTVGWLVTVVVVIYVGPK